MKKNKTGYRVTKEVFIKNKDETVTNHHPLEDEAWAFIYMGLQTMT